MRGLISTSVSQAGKDGAGDALPPVPASTAGRRGSHRSFWGKLICDRVRSIVRQWVNLPASGRPWLVPDSLRQVEWVAE